MPIQLTAEHAPALHYGIGGSSALEVPREMPAAVGRCIASCHNLLSGRADVPEAGLVEDIRATYGSLDPDARACFFELLAQEFSAESTTLRRAPEGCVGHPSNVTFLEPQGITETPRQALFLRLQAAPRGTAFLVGMRQHLLQSLGDHPSRTVLEADLAHVLKSVFDYSLLEFHRIDWETPVPVLEKLMRYEAVHRIADWIEMRRRLEADRRCYAFFHPEWPGEPLIFTEVALTRGISATVRPLLDPQSPVLDEESCDCAIFYSITNCEQGLRGFAFGNALIGRVVDELRVKLPRLRTFATLSPIPGFRPWLSALATSLVDNRRLTAILATLNDPGWSGDARVSAELEAELVPLCAHYLLHAKQGVEPADLVARFHLANGACLRRLNWLSDTSQAGMSRSVGLTANYLYHPVDLARNHAAYVREHKMNSTRQLERLSRQATRAFGVRPSHAALQIPA